MKKTVFLFISALLLGAVASKAEKPNIVFIIADDCTYRDMGCYGGQAYTPNIDQLATEGMRFTRCFQTAPMCSPTRHNIYTGLYPVKSGAYPNHTKVPKGTLSLVQHLKPLGYRVAQSGKLHVGPTSVFDWEHIDGNKNPEFSKVETFVSTCKTNQQPFCLLLCSNEPHTPWNLGDPSRYPVEKLTLPPYFVDTPETRNDFAAYLAEVTYFDDQVGQTISILKKQGLYKNTLLIVVSEQGNAFPFAKWTCYDSGLQSAFIAHWPGQIKSGTVNPAMIEYVDILPTFIEVAGGTVSPALDGKSLLPVFAGKQDHKKAVYGIMTTRGVMHGSDYFGIRSIRTEQFKLIWNLTPKMKFQNACTREKTFKSWMAAAKAGDPDALEKVTRYQYRPEFELYDIVKDPLEMNNLADNPEYKTVIAELDLQLKQWMEQCGDQGQETELAAYEHTRRGDPSKKAKEKIANTHRIPPEK